MTRQWRYLLSNKIALGFAVILLLGVSVWVEGYLTVSAVRFNFEKLGGETVPRGQTIDYLYNLVLHDEQDLRAYVDASGETAEELRVDLDDRLLDLKSTAKSYLNHYATPLQQDVFRQTVTPLLAEWVQHHRRVVSSVSAGKTPEATALIARDARRLDQELSAAFEKLHKVNDDETNAGIAEARALFRRSLLWQIGTLGAAMLITVVIGINNTRLFRDLQATLERERQALRDKLNLTRYVSRVAQAAATAEDVGPLDARGSVRPATVMFCDIRGFTRMSEELDPQSLVAILNAYLSRMEEIIDRYGGVVDKFIGDGIMAVFLPSDVDDDEVMRATRAALEMQAKVFEMSAQKEFPAQADLWIGIGINTGEVVLGNIGSHRRMDYTVIGDDVNVAARLESNARPGQILMSARAAERIRDRMPLEPLGAIRVKGKNQEVEVFTLPTPHR